MRRFIRAAAVILLAACGGSDGGPSDPGGGNSLGSIRGNVNDNTGAPVPSATVNLTGNAQSSRSTTTGTDGAYTFPNVAVGAYTVAVTPPAGFAIGTASTATITVTSGQQANVSAFVLNRTTTGGPLTLVDVSMVNTQFSPQQVEVAVGGRVRFTNNDNIEHNATSSSFQTGNMSAGQVREQVMPTAGTFAYSCTLHAGMNGTITVR
jgi:plastocyanin